MAGKGQGRGGSGVALGSLQAEDKDGGPRWCEGKKNRQRDEKVEWYCSVK